MSWIVNTFVFNLLTDLRIDLSDNFTLKILKFLYLMHRLHKAYKYTTYVKLGYV